MKRLLMVLLFLLTTGLVACHGRHGITQPTLDIYFLDMKGGASTLIVTPLGESILIDTGSRTPDHRDANRIDQAIQDAGLEHIDHLVTTHFHSDHFGGLGNLADRVPINAFYDKGALPPEKESGWFKELYPRYRDVTGDDVTTVRAGDDIPLRQDPAGHLPALTLHCLAAEKQVEGFRGDIDAPVPGFEIREPDTSDNARSIALLLSYGDFAFFAGGDITWNVEHHLVRPDNRIGQVDLYQVTHHGLDLSNNPLLIQSIEPVVAVAMNGPRKGVQPGAFRTLSAQPSLQALYQLNYNTRYGAKGNTDPALIANPEGTEGGNYVKAAVSAEDGTIRMGFREGGEARSFSYR